MLEVEAAPTKRTARHRFGPIEGAVLGLTVLTFALCLHDLGTRSIWVDEGASYAIASQHGLALFRAIERDGGNLAAYYVLLHVVIDLFGSGTRVLRLPSALAAASVVPLTYAIGRNLFDRRVGLMGAALISMSLPLVYWGQMARGYTLGTALSAASSLAFLRVIRSGRSRELFLWGLCSVLLCYTLLLGAFIVLAQLLSLAFYSGQAQAVTERDAQTDRHTPSGEEAELERADRPGARQRLNKWRIVRATPLMGIFCLPLLWLMVRRGGSQLFWLKRPNSRAVRAALSFLASAHYLPKESTSADLLVALMFAFGFAAVVLMLLDWRAKRSTQVFAAGFLLTGTVVMPVIVYLISHYGPSVFIDRYFAPCLPAATLLGALLLARVRPRALGTLGCAALCAMHVGQLIPTYGVVVDEWRNATGYVLENARPGDCIAFYANDAFVDFGYYLSHPPADFPRSYVVPRPVLPADSFASDPAIIEQYATLSSSQLAAVRASCPRLFVIEAHDGVLSGTPGSRSRRLGFITMQKQIALAYSQSTVVRFPAVSDYIYFGPPAPGWKAR